MPSVFDEAIASSPAPKNVFDEALEAPPKRHSVFDHALASGAGGSWDGPSLPVPPGLTGPSEPSLWEKANTPVHGITGSDVSQALFGRGTTTTKLRTNIPDPEHPTFGAVRDFIGGSAADASDMAANMFATPTGLALAAAGPIGEGAEALNAARVAKGAQALRSVNIGVKALRGTEAAAGATFAGQGVFDAAEAAMDPNATGLQKAARVSGAAGQALLGTAGAVHGVEALHPTPEVTTSEAPQSVPNQVAPQSVTPPESPKQSIEPEYVGDTVSPSSSPAAPAELAPQRLASDLARPTTPVQPEIAPVETLQKPTENTAQSIPTLQDVANDWRQTAQAGPSPDRQILAGMALNPAEDIGSAVRQQMPPMPRGERRAIPRTDAENQTQQLFGQSRQELGEDATSDQIMARVEELKRPSVTPEPLPMAPADPLAGLMKPDIDAAAPIPLRRFQGTLIPNGSGESTASVEALNRIASEKAQGVSRVVVDTRSGAERPLIGADAVDYQPKAFESVEYRGGTRDGEVIDQGAKARAYTRKSTALAASTPTTMAKSEGVPEPDSARIGRNLDEVNRLLEGDPAVKRAREIRKGIVPQVIEIRKMRTGLRAKLAKIRQNPGMEAQIPIHEQQIAELTNQEQQLTKVYRETNRRLGDQPTTRYTKVNYSPERNERLSEEGKAKATATIQAKVDAAHVKIKRELSVTSDPKRKAQLENWLDQPVVEVGGKGIRSDVGVSAGKNGPELQTNAQGYPEISLKTVRTLRQTVGNSKPLRSLLDLVPEDHQDALRELRKVDPQAARQAVQDAARQHVEGIRDNLAQQHEAAKSREAAEAGRPFKPSTPTRNILRDLKNGKRTIADLSDKEVNHLLDNQGVVKQELGPSERMAKKGENGQGAVLQKNHFAEKFIDRLQSEQADRSKAVIEGEITPHDAVDFAETLRDHIASKSPLSEEGHNVLAELGINSKKPRAEVVAKLGKIADRAHDEAGFVTAGMLFDLRKLPGEAWRQFIADPVLKRIGMADKQQSIREISPALADLFKRRDHAPQALREESFQNTKNLVGNAPHEKERLAVLFADATSREHLRTDHPAEYQQALNDPEVQAMVQRYKPYAQELTAQRQQRGGATVSDDYVRRVYENHMSDATGNQPYEKAVSGRDLPNQSRQATAEYYYQNGTHEFGASYGTKYVSEGMISLDKDIVKQVANEGVVHPRGEPLPDSIKYSDGKTYYSREQAKLVGSKDVYGVFDPLKTLKFKVGENVILAPKDIVDVASATERGPNFTPNWAIRGIQKGVIGLSGGIPHVANLVRRTINSFEGGIANPRGAKAVYKILLDKELRVRAESGPNDTTLRELARRGATRFDLENSMIQSKNPLMRFGHDLLYKPGSVGGLGGIQQRAQMYLADRLINENPNMSWDEVSQRVENQYGKASKQNWTKTQQGLAHAVPFPGWLYSSIQQGLKHPLRATVGAAALVYGINQSIHQMGGNRREDANDISRIHVGDYSFSPTVFNEPFAKVVAGPALDSAQALIRGGSSREISKAGMQSMVKSPAKSMNALLPYYAAPLEVMYNRPFAGTEKAIYNDQQWDEKGKTGMPVAVENILKHIGTRVIPQLGRAVPEGQSGGDVPSSLLQLAGSQVGLPMFKQDAEARLLKNLAATGEASHTIDTYKTQRPLDLAQLETNEPAIGIDDKFHAQFEKIQKRLKQLDDVAIAFPENKAAIDATRTVLLSAADEINDTYQEVRQNVLNQKTDKPIDKVKQMVTGSKANAVRVDVHADPAGEAPAAPMPPLPTEGAMPNLGPVDPLMPKLDLSATGGLPPNVVDKLSELYKSAEQSYNFRQYREEHSFVYNTGGHPGNITTSAAPMHNYLTVYPNTAGIVHTHPMAADPKPSQEDIAVATSKTLPNYILSRDQLWVANPDGTTAKIGDVRQHKGKLAITYTQK